MELSEMWAVSRQSQPGPLLHRVAEHLADKTELAVTIYREVAEALTECGDFRIHPQKTRIAFISRMTCAGVSLARSWVDLTLVLPEPVDDEAVRRIDLYGPTSWNHHLRLCRPSDVDGKVRTWLCRALRRGDQVTLESEAEVPALTGRLLALVRASCRVGLVQVEDEPVLRLPRHLADAFSRLDRVLAKVGRDPELPLPLVRSGGWSYLRGESIRGLDSGEQIDLQVRAAPAG